MRLKPRRSWFTYIGAATLGAVLLRLIADYLFRVPFFKLLESAVLGWANGTLAENRVVIVEVAATVIIDWVLPLILVAIIIFALYQFLKWHILRQMQRVEATVEATSGSVLPAVEQTIYQRLFSARSLANLINLAEIGTWSPRLSFQENGDLEVEVTYAKGDYWNLGKEWALEGWITVTLRYSSASGYARISGLPITIGTGDYSVECEAVDGSFQVTRDGQLDKGRAETWLPFSTNELHSGMTYRFHLSANYLSDY